jgi:hypothetical protein
MTTRQQTEFTRPDAHPAKNVRRAGAPNTQLSGEIPMVGTHHTAGHVPDLVTVDAVRTRLNGQAHRFVTVTRSGQFAVHMDDLAMLIAEIVTDITAGEGGGSGA